MAVQSIRKQGVDKALGEPARLFKQTDSFWSELLMLVVWAAMVPVFMYLGVAAGF